MSLDKLYDDVILDHIHNARNYRKLPDAQREAEAHSRLCGDSITVYVKLDGERIEDIAFQCSSCAISMAAASIMTEAVKGKNRAEAQALGQSVTRAIEASDDNAPAYAHRDQTAIFAALHAFPARKTCATVAWHALGLALREDGGESVEVG
jgi:nitrogen fixation protein NifU and related proteins